MLAKFINLAGLWGLPLQKALGLNNMQMAKCLGVYPVTVSTYRRGIGGIRGPIIRLLEQARQNETEMAVTDLTGVMAG